MTATRQYRPVLTDEDVDLITSVLDAMGEASLNMATEQATEDPDLAAASLVYRKDCLDLSERFAALQRRPAIVSEPVEGQTQAFYDDATESGGPEFE